MIDLHIHTKHSDGTDSVEEILKKANDLNLGVISITDHDNCDAYYELEKLNIKDYYNGKIIVGCEFTTSFDNKLIEVLGYGIDYKKVKTYLLSYNSIKDKSKKILYDRLINNIKDSGLKYDVQKTKEDNIQYYYFTQPIYEELKRYSENKDILNEDVFNTLSDFFRKGLTNPKSKLFINHAEFKPPIKEVIDFVHNSGGVAFLAHPYVYQFDDTEAFLNKIYNETNLDGIECFHTKFNKEEVNYLLDFAKKRNLLISGGSDYHGLNKKNHNFGFVNNNLNISKDILNNWNIKYFKL